MDLTQLEMFNAVAEAGSITQAAAKVHRVPSNLTTRLRQLETELGVDLFIRENQRLRLSPAGHNFLRYSQQILALVDEARSVVAGDEPQGLFSLGSLESTAAVRIPATLAQFNRRYPKIQFSLSTGPSGTMLEGVLEGKLNAAFIDGPINHTAIDGIPVYREELMIVTPQGHAPVTRASQVNGSNIMPSAPIVRIVATSRAGFMLTVPLRELSMRWSLITECWPVWSQEQVLRLFRALCWKVCRGITRLRRGR